MSERRIGIIMNGVTGRMGTNQHLIRSILAIRNQRGLRLRDGSILMPDPILVGRNQEKLQALAKSQGIAHWSIDLDSVLGDSNYELYFDASTTQLRPMNVERAIRAGKAIYCEKPVAVRAEAANRLAQMAEDAGLPNGVVQDKLWLPGIVKLRRLIDRGFFGRILSVRGEFGYWVFTGEDEQQPAQRPSWNYRADDGGGIMLDMFCHWQYVIENLFGRVARLVAIGATDIPTRIDERGEAYEATADDAAYAIFQLDSGLIAQFNSSWTTRVRRDDLMTIQVDGTLGTAVAGLRECRVQSLSDTPRPVWNPDVPQPIEFYNGWREVDAGEEFDNAFKIQWEMFLRHVAEGAAWPHTIREGARGVRFAEAGLESWHSRAWVDLS